MPDAPRHPAAPRQRHLLALATSTLATLVVAMAFSVAVLGGALTAAASSPPEAPAGPDVTATTTPVDPSDPDTDPAAPTTQPTTTAPETTAPAVDDPANDEDAEVGVPDARRVGLPTEPPPGFTEDQYRRFVQVVSACGFDGGRICEWVLDLTGNEGLAEFSQWLYDVPFRLLIIAAIAFGINRLIRRGVTRYVTRSDVRRELVSAHELDDPERLRRDALRTATVAGTIGGTATVAIITIAAMVALGELGVTLGPLLAGAGIVGIALGFGAQNLVRDVLAGLFVLLEDQYGVGDIIDAGRATGKVEGITLRITKVRDVHGTLWFVPNGVITEVGNLTQLWSRAIIDFDIDYRADHERAGEIIKETADRLWDDADAPVRILEEPELWGVESLGDSSVVIRIAVKTAPADQWALARLLRSEVKKALDAEGIEIPFPQHTVWIHADPLPGDRPSDASNAADR